MKSPDPTLYLTHILESIELAKSYVQGVDLIEIQKLQDTVIRRIEIIGEAVKNLLRELREASQKFPRRRIAGMRDQVIHDYMGVDVELVWTVVHRDFQGLAREVRALLGKDPVDGGTV